MRVLRILTLNRLTSPAALNPLALPYGASRWLHDLAGPMKCSTTGISATVSSVTLSRVSEIIAQQSLTSMRPPSTSKAHNAKETRNHEDKEHGHQTLAESCTRHHARWQRGDLLIARHDRRLERRRRPRSPRTAGRTGTAEGPGTPSALRRLRPHPRQGRRESHGKANEGTAPPRALSKRLPSFER